LLNQSVILLFKLFVDLPQRFVLVILLNLFPPGLDPGQLFVETLLLQLAIFF
jgi:hypothetical protein